MTSYRRLGASLALILIWAFCWFSGPGFAQTRGEAEQFDASFVDLNSGRTGPVQISVTRWSTPGERTELTQTLFKDGQEALLDAVRDMRAVGRIYIAGLYRL